MVQHHDLGHMNRHNLEEITATIFPHTTTGTNLYSLLPRTFNDPPPPYAFYSRCNNDDLGSEIAV